MKRNLLGVAVVGLSVFGYLAVNNSPEKQYVPRSIEESNEAAGAIAYLHAMRANQVTGEVDPADVAFAELQLGQLASSNKTAALGLNFESKGPDNGGGRTRAFIIDKDSVNVLYAAGVAGGVYKSKNAGLSWFSVSDGLTNLATVALTQSANGDLYVGTGETMFARVAPGTGTRSSAGMTGGGIFKSTDHGATWTLLATTAPPANNNSSIWSEIGALGADPVNANRIYASTAGGIRRSDDGGATWTNPIGQSGVSMDLAVATNGAVWADLNGRTFYSSNGNDNTWAEVSKSAAGTTDLPRSSSRQKYSVSAQDPNTVYCVQLNGSELAGLYRTYDNGVSWELIQEKTTLFDPMCSTGTLGQCQGIWDLMLGVSPHDKDHIFLGGVTIWEWKKNSGWRQVDSQFIPVFDVHSDKHTITWDPLNEDIIYCTTDGGVHKSSDGGYTWQDMNKNYMTTQFYNINIGKDRKLIGGTQDNGTWYIDGQGNTPLTGYTLGGVDGFRGDGGFSAISWLDNEQMFTEYQYGRMGRSGNEGVSFSSFWDGRMDPTSKNIWMLPFYLYETTNDPLSADSVLFNAYPSVKSEGFANGDTTFVNSLTKAQESGEFVASSFQIKSGGLLITSNAQGVLSGDGYGTFDALTGDYDATFTSVPIAEVIVRCNVSYPQGATIKVGSNINELPYNHQLVDALAPFDSVMVQDPVQSIVVAGMNGAVWMTRMAHNWSDVTKWWKIASMPDASQSVTMSADGNYVWVGTQNGLLVRVSGINEARSLATADIDQGTDLKITSGVVRNFTGRNITGIAVDPNDPDRVAVTLGNYGNSSYIYYSSDATSSNPTFSIRQGNLPPFPVYSVTFDKGNSASLIVGTEYGMFTTENIQLSIPTWTEENNGIPRIPVYTLVQYRTNDNSSDANNPVMEGDLFVGTHGRGMYVTEDLMTARPVDIQEEAPLTFAKANEPLKLFPNPAVDFTTAEVYMKKASDVAVFVRDLNGRVVKQLKFNRLSAGKQNVRVNTSDLASGTYLLTVQAGDNVSSGKFVVTK